MWWAIILIVFMIDIRNIDCKIKHLHVFRRPKKAHVKINNQRYLY